jgi:hypothetical protein
MDRASIRLTVVLTCAALLLVWAIPARSRKPAPAACPDARYLLPAPLLTTPSPAGRALAAGATAVAIDEICDPIAPKRFKGSAKGTRVAVVWPSCTGVNGTVKLTATIASSCDTLSGKVKAKRFKRKLAGSRSRCGDAVMDVGEACEPPDSATCDAQCRARVSGTIGGPGGTLVSDDGLLSLGVPAGAVPGDTIIAIRKLDAAEAAAAGAEMGYALGPDGLQFAAPVTVTLRLPETPVATDGSIGADVGVLFTTDAAGGNRELPSVQDALIDGVANLATISAEVTHFSNVFLFRPQRPADPMAAFTRVRITPGTRLVPTQTFTPSIEFQSAAEFVNTQTVVHTDETVPGDRVVYSGPSEVALGTVGGGTTRVAAPVSGYACGPLEGIGEYRGRVAVRSAGFLGFGAQTSLTTHLKVLIECLRTPTTTTSTSSTTSTSTSTVPVPTVPTTSVTSTSSTSSTSTTSTSSTSSTSTSSTTSSTLPSPGNCCDCAPPLGCASGPTISPTLCATTCNGMAGAFLANHECSLDTGNCVSVGRAVVLSAAVGSLPAGTQLCLHRVSSGCIFTGPECTNGAQELPHLHRQITVQGEPGTFPDPNPTGCGHGAVVANVRGCMPDTVPPCQ